MSVLHSHQTTTTTTTILIGTIFVFSTEILMSSLSYQNTNPGSQKYKKKSIFGGCKVGFSMLRVEKQKLNISGCFSSKANVG